ncbi:hypothetical protein FTO74_11785 [Granulicella sp. WH15]|uniref:hypothetical protein n=1 Tax=Granulicella sp. WH15 TaxID=2602070 RepID=UPI0013673BF4|nr:hypothetical protein [Granulicella sp. WH15]QHN03977.1 hypothetical protein FTO74_11785 [Granulicella sp. WH15]
MNRFSTRLALAIFSLSSPFLSAQTLGDKPTTSPDGMDGVILVVGLEQVKPNTKGLLLLSPEALLFSSNDVRSSIPRDRITNVFIGDERTEPWGTTGKVVRKIIPYGGGAALGAATNKKVDLLTVEFRDTHDAYHGVVFVLPTQKAGDIRDQIMARLAPPAEHPASSCSVGEAKPRSVLLAPIAVSGIDLPAEYRILLYEQTIKQLKIKRPADIFLRVGDATAGSGCVATLKITVTNFKKGNRAVRVSSGPVGLFVGTTSLTFNVDLEDFHGNNVFHTQIKKSNRSDSDSLDLADGIAKNTAKRFDKALAQSAPQGAGTN